MKSDPSEYKGLPVLGFERREDWAAWLSENHAASSGIWLHIAKKASKMQSMSYDEAVEVALCFGWIDSQAKSYDESSWLQKFTRRGAKSIWSKLNRERAEKLIESGQMKPAGLQAVEAAKLDGRWVAAYDSPSTAEISPDFQAELDKSPQAKAFFETLESRNRYAILHRIQTARKPETRARRIQQFIEMLEKHQKLYP